MKFDCFDGSLNKQKALTSIQQFDVDFSEEASKVWKASSFFEREFSSVVVITLS